jgi:hypothetical protein
MSSIAHDTADLGKTEHSNTKARFHLGSRTRDHIHACLTTRGVYNEKTAPTMYPITKTRKFLSLRENIEAIITLSTIRRNFATRYEKIRNEQIPLARATLNHTTCNKIRRPIQTSDLHIFKAILVLVIDVFTKKTKTKNVNFYQQQL